MDPNEDTEWNDILRSKGILPEKEPDVDDVLDDALVDAKELAHENRLEKKTLDELDELEDEEDDEFLQIYRNKRIEEWKQRMSKAKYGAVYPISKPEYTKEVTEDSKNVFVVVHMFQDSIPACKLLNGILERLAPMYPQIKFVKIAGKQAVENYPDIMMPTLLVYGHGDLQQQFLTLTTLGGMGTTVYDVAKALVHAGALKEEDIAPLREASSLNFESGRRANEADEEEDFDDFD
ncbi:phosducin family protein [Schizosaccharomyces octosporus yFS286]|uniref:Phosducin family protein n=1 Tax=Schizosaccharomyces octosporus (strain yFS286) TaxID=483514 RepID=S9REK5_SCHOY|nr:phosducin family protein [Schizosaccharomyces octosporus yFS286]EPX72504.1 phosducin family protein [Schizosaccharomyces octosporus yFS286]